MFCLRFGAVLESSSKRLSQSNCFFFFTILIHYFRFENSPAKLKLTLANSARKKNPTLQARRRLQYLNFGALVTKSILILRTILIIFKKICQSQIVLYSLPTFYLLRSILFTPSDQWRIQDFPDGSNPI